MGIGLTSGGVVGVCSWGGGVVGGEVDLDLDRDLERFRLCPGKLRSVGLMFKESRESLDPTMESIEKPNFDLELAEFGVELAWLAAAAAAAAATAAAAAAALWGKVTDIMGGSAARVIFLVSIRFHEKTPSGYGSVLSKLQLSLFS